ncbi:MAG: hypothetical protein JXR91_10310 [Deltaproteobacteria bacterium]|nr:hypothetical protein [Deltaproteobacteria bacterium]
MINNYSKYENSKLLAFFAVAGTVWICFFTYLHHFTFADDSFIFFRYANNIVTGHGPVFNINERVEGFTSPLWLALLTLCQFAHIEILHGATLLGTFFTIATFLSVLYFKGLYTHPLLRISCGLFILVQPWVMFWATSGMETFLFTFLIVATFSRFFVEREKGGSHYLSGVMAGLTFLSRPDAVIMIVVLQMNRQRIRSRFQFLSALAIFPFLYEIFRIYYYGQLLPNTAVLKMGFSFAHLSMGLNYIRNFITDNPVFFLSLIPAVMAIFNDKEFQHERNLIRQIYLFIIWNMVYFIFIGGDFFENHRFFVSLFPFMALLSAIGLQQIYSLISIKKYYGQKIISIIAPASIVVIVSLVSFKVTMLKSGHGIFWITNAGKLGLSLGKELSHQNLVASSHIGALGYYSNLPVLDLLGLTDSVIAKTPVDEDIYKTYSKRDPGHEKFNIPYSLSRDPDVFVLLNGLTSVKATDKSEVQRSFAMEHKLMTLLESNDQYAVDNIKIAEDAFWMVVKKCRDNRAGCR